jgi:hypothetical protein
MTTTGKMTLYSALISTSLTIITTFTILGFTNSREDGMLMRNELKKKASIEYVDDKLTKTEKSCKEYADNNMKAIEVDISNIKENIKSQKETTDNIYNFLLSHKIKIEE